MRRHLTSILLLSATVGLILWQEGVFHSSSAQAVKPVAPASATALRLGVTTEPLARNWWHPWKQSDLATVDTFERDASHHASIVMWYADWQHNAAPLHSQLNAIAHRGSVPQITWEPWDASKPLYQSQPHYRLGNIIAGRFDRHIWSWARDLAAWHRPVMLRFAQEMDGNWYPWSDYGNGNKPGQFVQAWRHVHHIFDLAGARNVRWVWSPAFGSAATFPGTRFVDVMATTCQNGGKKLFARGWQTFQRGCGNSIERLHALAPHLPIQLAEAGSSEEGGSKAQWIAGMFAYLAHHREVTSVVWFNLVKKTDWRIESSPAAQRAFAAGITSA